VKKGKQKGGKRERGGPVPCTSSPLRKKGGGKRKGEPIETCKKEGKERKGGGADWKKKAKVSLNERRKKKKKTYHPPQSFHKRKRRKKGERVNWTGEKGGKREANSPFHFSYIKEKKNKNRRI